MADPQSFNPAPFVPAADPTSFSSIAQAAQQNYGPGWLYQVMNTPDNPVYSGPDNNQVSNPSQSLQNMYAQLVGLSGQNPSAGATGSGSPLRYEQFTSDMAQAGFPFQQPQAPAQTPAPTPPPAAAPAPTPTGPSASDLMSALQGWGTSVPSTPPVYSGAAPLSIPQMSAQAMSGPYGSMGSMPGMNMASMPGMNMGGMGGMGGMGTSY